MSARASQAQLAEARDEIRQNESRMAAVGTLESRVEVLLQERAALVAEVEHAAHVKQLFATVTCKTNEVQQVANSVIEAVEARKRAQGPSKPAPTAGDGAGNGVTRPALRENLPEQRPRQPTGPRAGARTPRSGAVR